MRQWLASLMLCVMLLSHGSVGAAVPHAHDGAHAQAADNVSVHHDADQHNERIGADADEPVDEATDHAVHTHIVVALAQPTGALAPAPVGKGDGPVIASTLWGPSRDVSPLLEPPSA